MSNCRCADIKKCEGKIDKLRTNLQFVHNCETKCGNIKNELLRLKSYNTNAYVAEELSTLNSSMQEICNDMDKTADTLKEKIFAKIDELRNILSSLNEEDKDFHEHEGDNDDVES